MKIDKNIELIFEDIILMLYRDALTTMTVKNIIAKKYNLGSSRSYAIIVEAREYYSEYIINRNENTFDECLEILKMNRENAANAYDLKEVRECTKEIAKLHQLYINKVDVTSKGEKVIININSNKNGD